MTIQFGAGKKIIYKEESELGVDPGASSAQELRSVSSDLGTNPATYQSNERNPNQQINDMRLGLRQVGGTIRGELSCGTYKDFISAAVRKTWAAGGATSAATNISSTAGALGTQKISRAAGSFLTDGFKRGDAIAMTGWGTTMAVNNNRNYIILDVTALDMYLAEVQDLGYALSDTARTIVTLGAGDSVAIASRGYKAWVPQTGHIAKSYTIEHQFTDIGRHHRFNGCRVAGIDIGLPATGLSTFDTRVLGLRMQRATSAYFTSPTAATTTGVMAASNGLLTYNGGVSGLVTGATIRVDDSASVGPVVGSNYSPDVFVGRIIVSGQFTAYFQDDSITVDALNEAAPSLVVALTENNLPNSNIFVVNIPKLKMGNATPNDVEGGLIITAPFTAVFQGAGGSGNHDIATTIVFQDSTITS